MSQLLRNFFQGLRKAPVSKVSNGGNGMLTTLLDSAHPPSAQREEALALLAGVLEVHANLRLPEVLERRIYLAHALSRPQRGLKRQLQTDLARVDRLYAHLSEVRGRAVEHAPAKLDAVLRLVGGPVRCIELGPQRFAARVADREQPQGDVRILLLPEAMRALRIQVQPVREGVRAIPRCLGPLGDVLADYSLDRLDLSTLVLTLLSYLNMN